jgi:tetratricopeptide (TPR) repeat protein
MNKIYKLLSGNIPGGLFVLLFALLIVNLISYLLFKKSELFERSVYKKRTIQLNLFFIFLYFFIWFLLQPAQLPKTVLIQPFQKGDSTDFTISEIVERGLTGNLSPKFRLHPWEWFYLTANKDSINLPSYRRNLAGRLNIAVVVGGYIANSDHDLKLDLDIQYAGKAITLNYTCASYRDAALLIIKQLGLHTNILRQGSSTGVEKDEVDFATLTRAKLAYLNKNYDLTLQLLNSDSLYLSRIIMSRALLKKGLEQKDSKATPVAESGNEVNPLYRRMERLLLPYSIKDMDTAEINSVLGQMYLYRGDYETANICLKKAVSQNPYDARLYYYLSFLDIERLKEMKYSDRIDILRQAIRLDPGYAECILRLANDVYNKGSGTSVARTTYEAIAIMEDYLKINPTTVPILKLLGKIYVQISDTPRATALFQKVIALEPDTADNYYDLGVCYFNDKQYEQAKKLFERAIQLGDHRESYLYLGAVYWMQGDLQKSLYYYRERIRRKINDDDYYALEAMRGVRLILEKMAADSIGGKGRDSVRTPNLHN